MKEESPKEQIVPMPVWDDGRMSDEVSGRRRLDMDRAAAVAAEAAGVDQNSARTGQLGG